MRTSSQSGLGGAAIGQGSKQIMPGSSLVGDGVPGLRETRAEDGPRTSHVRFRADGCALRSPRSSVVLNSLTFSATVAHMCRPPEAPAAWIGRRAGSVAGTAARRVPPVAAGVAPVLRIEAPAGVCVPEAALAAGHQDNLVMISQDAVAAAFPRHRHWPMGYLVAAFSGARGTTSARAIMRAMLHPVRTFAAVRRSCHSWFSGGKSPVVQPPPRARIKPTLA